MRKTIAFWSLATILIFAAQSCNFSKPDVSYEDTKTFDISDFTSLKLEVVGKVYYEQSDSVFLKVSGSSHIIENIQVSNNDQELFINFEKKNPISIPKEKLVIRIGSPKLNVIYYNGVGTLHLKNRFESDQLTVINKGVGKIKITDAHVDYFNLTSQGVGTIEVSGVAEETIITSDGVGNIDCSKLIAQNAEVVSKGVGNLKVYAKNNINIQAKGIGNVKYYGHPSNVVKDASGIGKIKKGD